MKVALPVSSAFPSDGGGYTFESEIVAALIAIAPEIAHDITILSAAVGDLGQAHKSITIVHPPSLMDAPTRWGTGLAQASGQPQLISVANRLRSAWVRRYLRQQTFDFAWVLAPAALAQVPTHHMPYALTVWDVQHRLQPYFPEVSQGREWGKRERFYADHLPRATTVVTGTERGKFELEHFYRLAPERVTVMPFPTPTLAVPPEQATSKQSFLTRYDLPQDYCFYPAQFWPHKNHATLLRSLHRAIHHHGLDTSLVLTGSDKGNAAYIRQLIGELGLQSRVRILGFVPQADLANLYRYAQALVFPTHFGPDNLPPLEAFALGCPVVASAVPGATEQLGDAALLVNPTDPNAIAQAMHQVCTDADLRQGLIDRGLTRAGQWTPTDYARALVASLDEFERLRTCWPTHAACDRPSGA
ncbi:glycosyltransferase family 4 protein [Nodosilinea sp. LEGE 07088]|uniref:glycosyltransferase family 4 protein n=1 Tax=Nodosilinea sp. LEGE 07088 TaxID=2777968 RepID=UPI0019E801BF|nr:glycosyltransferase family 1 protein [Nodosilinea sp. LEGE 07088]MBE9138799.1 glycosyltransferase family 4 protein [Nodosilinea sp. LEGE 07088]